MDALKIIQAGLLTTVQDLGRFGYQKFGVPLSGALDSFSLRIGNILVGNEEGAAGFEITLMGPKIEFLNDLLIAITGANLNPHLNNKPAPMWEAIEVKKGDELSFKGVISGIRSYLAISGGIDVPLVLKSRSTYIGGKIGGFSGRAIQQGDIIKSNGQLEQKVKPGTRCPEILIPKFEKDVNLKVIMGPQDDYFDEKEGIEVFLSSEYTVTSKSDRMGYRLEGEVIKHRKDKPKGIISEPTVPGGIQIPPEGQPIILLMEQTVGGYPKIATVISTEIRKVGQAKPGDKIRFERIDIEEAHNILINQENLIKEFKEKVLTGK